MVGAGLGICGDVLAQDAAGGEPSGEVPGLSAWVLIVWAVLAAGAVVAGARLGWLRVSTARRDAAVLSPTGWLGLALAVFVAQGLGAALVLGVWPADDPLRVSSSATWGGSLGVLVAWALASGRWRLGASGARVSGRDLWVGALVCAGAVPLVTVASLAGQAVGVAMGHEARQLTHETLVRLQEGTTPGVYLLTVGAVVLAAPVAEEFLFRGCVQTAFVRVGMGRWGAVLAASGVFLTVHLTVLDPAALPALFVLSVVLGLAYEKTGRLGTPVVAHACFNALNLLIAGV